MIMYANNELKIKELGGYCLFQVSGAITGTLLANYMFGLDLLQFSTNSRTGINLYFSEMIATFGLLLVILRVRTLKFELIAPAVGLYITAAYWFTSSTSFANPAVTIGRMLTDTFTGIQPENVLLFIISQLIGAFLAYLVNKLIEAD